MDHSLIVLRPRKGRELAIALIDRADVERVSPHQWQFLCSGRGYACIRKDGVTVLLHRFILGEPPFLGAEVDHINGDGLDNRRANLRWVTRAENLQNKRVYKNSQCGVRGVCLTAHGRWRARVQQYGRPLWQRYFATLSEASMAVREARRRLLTHSVEEAA